MFKKKSIFVIPAKAGIQFLTALLSLLLFLPCEVAIAKSLPTILSVVKNEPSDLDDIQSLVEYRWYDKAWEALQKYSSDEEKVQMLKARALAGMKQYDDALPLFHDLSLHGSSAKIRQEALMKEAMVLTKLQKYSEALQKYRQLMGQEKKSGARKNLLWRVVKTAIEAKDYEEALKMLRSLSGPQALWWQGWANYQMGKYTLALQSWNKIHGSPKVVRARRHRGRGKGKSKAIVKGGGALPAQVAYWKAMALQQLGKSDEAMSLLQDLVEKYPVSYYAILSLAELYPSDSDFEAAVKALWSEHASEKYLGIYSKDYQDDIKREAKLRHLDPNLIFALAWQESRFRDSVVSPTGAIGLMQLMPQTALQVASAAQLKHFDVESIFDPAVNIHLGALYIKFLQGLFFNQIPYAIAAYNAGEEAVSRWLSLRDQDPVAVFVEEIPYEETQDYTRKVLMAYWIYRWLNEGQLPQRFAPNATSTH